MAIKIGIYALGACLCIGFAWFTATIVVLGLREFFNKRNNNKKNK